LGIQFLQLELQHQQQITNTSSQTTQHH
jgi:hypothetical protein